MTTPNRFQGYSPPLQIVGYLASRRGDEERGPRVWINEEEARKRLILDGELVWVHGPRRHDLAPVTIDESVPRGGVVVRDLAGVAVSEVVRLIKPDLDRATGPGPTFA